MQRLINFIRRSFKSNQDDSLADTGPLPIIEPHLLPKRQTNEATRPTYRLSNVKPSDFHKAIDLSG